MSFISMEFLNFFTVALVIYYLIPKRFQWFCLLCASYLYYLASGTQVLVFLLTTTMSTFVAGLWLNRMDAGLVNQLKNAGLPLDGEKKKRFKEQTKHQKKLIVLGTLLLNFGILVILKYANFAIENAKHIFGTDFRTLNLLLPLGISFYTFQSMGYLIDVYRGKYKADRNPLHFALFVSFFPQLLQGPIGRFDRLAHQFFEEHPFQLLALERGVQRMLWGYFKKIVIADRVAVLVNTVFDHYENYHGMMIVLAVLGYSVQLYADFSGGVDVVIGIAQCFGIEMDENFKRPYFAVNISDFWHRWHITLGTWMKDYVFYSFSLSKGMNKFTKFAKKHMGKHTGRVLPVCISNLLVFFIVGVWHGAAWKFFVYGLYNGLLIAGSNLLAPLYPEWASACHVNVQSKGWKVVQILRTFLLVNISWYFDRAVSLSAAWMMIKNTFAEFSFRTFSDGSLFAFGLDRKDYFVLLLGCLVLFIVSLIQEQGINVRKSLSKQVLALRMAVYLVLIFSIPLLGYINTSGGGGFLYAQF